MTTETLTLSRPVTEKSSEARRADASGAPQAAGTFWFAGWLFTIGFAKLVWWKALLAVCLWPYFLGDVLR